MKHKVSELSGTLLDAAVAKAERAATGGGELDREPWLEYSTDWSAGGPIIEREKIATVFMEASDENGKVQPAWCAFYYGPDAEGSHYIDTYANEADGSGPTPLIAAMRAFVAAKLGPEVDLP